MDNFLSLMACRTTVLCVIHTRGFFFPRLDGLPLPPSPAQIVRSESTTVLALLKVKHGPARAQHCSIRRWTYYRACTLYVIMKMTMCTAPKAFKVMLCHAVAIKHRRLSTHSFSSTINTGK